MSSRRKYTRNPLFLHFHEHGRSRDDNYSVVSYYSIICAFKFSQEAVTGGESPLVASHTYLHKYKERTIYKDAEAEGEN